MTQIRDTGILALLLFLMSLNAGCSSSKESMAQPESLAHVNHLLQGRQATIQLKSGTTLKNVQSVRVGPETTEYGRATKESILTSEIATITIKGDSGAGVGFLFGIVPGTLILTGALVDTDAAYREFGIGLGIASAFVGGIVGGLLGDIATKRRNIVVYEAPLDRYLSYP